MKNDVDSGIEFSPKPARRERIPALLALSGPSGSGKTYSALLLARGMVGPEGKVLLIDTENRSSMYAEDAHIGGFMRQELRPPFSSERYRAMMRAAEQWGADCVIIDSASHEHEGEGGLLDFADQEEKRIGGRHAKRNKWIKPKADHNRWMNSLRGARCHVILCVREKIIVDMDQTPAKKIEVPVCGGDFLFEMLLHGRLCPRDLSKPIETDQDAHRCRWVKMPLPLQGVLPDGVRISVEHGEKLAAALNHGAEPDRALDAFLANAEEKARDGGRDALEAYWRETPADVQARAKPHMGRIGKLADASDQANQTEGEGAE